MSKKKKKSKKTLNTLNSMFKDLYKDVDLSSLVYKESPFLAFACPEEFRKKYGVKVWNKLGGRDQDFIRSQGMKTWEKIQEYDKDFEELIK